MIEIIFTSLAALMALAWFGVALSTARQARARRFDRQSLVLICPGTGEPADIVALHDRQSGRFTKIVSCSELPSGKRCRMSCLMLANCERLYDGDRR